MLSSLSIRWKLILIFLVIGILPLIITGIINITNANEFVRDRAIESEQTELEVKTLNIERFLDTTTEDIRFLARSTTVQAMSEAIAERDGLALQPARENVTREFENFIQQRTFNNQNIYARIRFLDKDGFEFVRVETVDGVVESNLNLNFRSSQAYFVEAKALPAEDIYISPVRLFDDYGEIQEPFSPLIHYSAPIYIDERLIGVLVTDVRAEGFLDTIQRNLNPQTEAFLVDQDGYYLAHPNGNWLYGRDLESDVRLESQQPQLLPALKSARGGFLEVTNQVVVYQPIQIDAQNRWTLFSARPNSAIFAPIRQQRDTLFSAFLIVVIPLIGIAIYFANTISRPLENLAETASLIARGDIRRRVEVTRQDEIGYLGGAFNDMTNQLSDLILARESQITERTRDLQIAADVSKQIVSLLDLDVLLQQVTDLTVKEFKFYAAFIFLYDPDLEVLTSTAGTIKDGVMGFKPHRMRTVPISASPSLIASVARSRQMMVANNVHIHSQYLRLPEMPLTQAELTMPLVLGDQLLGVFDLQADILNYFADTDLGILTTLGEQITIAIRNAQLFADAEAARKSAEQANEIKSQFLANMSHELRTPLNAILNFTEFVADGVMGDVNEEQEETLRKVISSGEHLLSLINDILDLAKIEVGMMELFIEKVNLNDELKTVLATGKGLVKQRPVKLESIIEPDLPIIQGDSRRLRQVMLNLLSNAIKFTPEGTVTLIARAEDGNIHMIVEDTGVGIPLEDVERIFENFQQVRQNAKVSLGTGLGLPISKFFVEAHGGQMWAESTTNEGSKFHVLLPTESPAAQSNPKNPLQDKLNVG